MLLEHVTEDHNYVECRGRVGELCMSPFRYRDTGYILTELPSPPLMHIYSYVSMQDWNSNFVC